jgi:hypothetical protein
MILPAVADAVRHVLLQEGEIELQNVVRYTHRVDDGGLGLSKDRLDMLGRVIEIPRPAIDLRTLP